MGNKNIIFMFIRVLPNYIVKGKPNEKIKLKVLHHNSKNYSTKLRPFTGTGQMLGTYLNFVTFWNIFSHVPKFTSDYNHDNNQSNTNELEIDESLPKCKVRIRLYNGKMLLFLKYWLFLSVDINLNYTVHTVDQLYQHISR